METPPSTPALRTRRWCNPAEPGDGLRVLICRFRPRGLLKKDETWDLWLRDLGPSPELLKAFQGKGVTPISLSAYKQRYLEEMESPPALAAQEQLLARLRAGESVTLLCSKDCIIEQACHRTLLAALLRERLEA